MKFQNSGFFLWGLLENYLTTPVMGFISLTKLGICNFNKNNLLLSVKISRHFISQKNLLVATANRHKVFKIFVPTKVIYSEPETRVWENLRVLAFRVVVWLHWNGKRYMLFQIKIKSKTCSSSLFFIQLRRFRTLLDV